MAQLGQDELVHGQLHRRRRAGKRDQDAAPVGAGQCPGHDRGRTDFLVAEVAEDLAEAVQPLVQKTRYRVEGVVACGNTGAAVQDDGLALRVLSEDGEFSHNPARRVFDDDVVDDFVPRLLQPVFDELSAAIRLPIPGVAHGDDGTADSGRPFSAMLVVRHEMLPFRVDD